MDLPIHILDFLILITLLYNAVIGFRRGLVRILTDLAALFVATSVTILYYKPFATEIQVSLGISSQFATYGIFIVMWLTVFGFMTLLGLALDKVLKITFLSPLNRLGGIVFGICRGALITFPFLLIIYWASPQTLENTILGKTSLPLIQRIGDNLKNKFHSDANHESTPPNSPGLSKDNIDAIHNDPQIQAFLKKMAENSPTK